LRIREGPFVWLLYIKSRPLTGGGACRENTEANAAYHDQRAAGGRSRADDYMPAYIG